MFVVIYEPSTDIVLLSRRMGPNEKLDTDKLADRYAASIDREIDRSDPGFIHNCFGDIRVEFRPRRDNGSVIWSGQSYYFKTEC